MWGTRLTGNTGRKNGHLCGITELCRAISSQLRHVSTIGKKNFLNSNVSPTCRHNMVNLRPTGGWDLLASLRHPCKFQRVSRLPPLLHSTLVVGISQALQRWTEGATYIRQGGRHIGHWPTFLVSLWLPYGIGQTIIFSSGFFFLLLFFPRLISAVRDWMFTILRHMVWP